METTINRSIKNAKTSMEVFQALVAQVTAANSIVAEGEWVKDIQVIRRPKGFVQSNGKEKFVCKTNKYTLDVQQGLKDLAQNIRTLDVDTAREAAYAISDKYGVVLSVWEDHKDKDALLNGRPFTATVRSRNYETKAGEKRTEIYFFDAFLQEVAATKGRTLNAEDFLTSIPDSEAIAQDNAAGEIKAEAEAVAAGVKTLEPEM